MYFAQEIFMKKEVNYMWKIIWKMGTIYFSHSLSFFFRFVLFVCVSLRCFFSLSFSCPLFFLFFWVFHTSQPLFKFQYYVMFCVYIGKKTRLPKICHTYPTMMKLDTLIPYLKKIQKYINHVIHFLISADICNFLPEIIKFCYIKKYRCRLYFDT